jgi:hypothetical protein
MSPLVSFEEEGINMRYIFGICYNEGLSQQMSLPRNLRPGWKNFEQERVFVGMNSMYKNEAITIRAPLVARAYPLILSKYCPSAKPMAYFEVDE